MASPPRSECLDEEALAGFICGALAGGALASVEGHLAECAECREVVADAARGALESGESEASPREARAELLASGDVVAGKYVIEGSLGRGGMGTVFTARHIELGHRVAIKVLHSTDATAAARFLREAKASAQLSSEHIVRVHDLGRLPAGAPYLVMEHLLGEDLARVIARGPVPVTTAVDYVLQICAALREAHGAGIIHRDLKPGNVFLTRRSDGQARLKVLDFGISKFASTSQLGSSQSLTLPESILGSPLYMSPEQIRASKDVGEATDLWSIGVIAYELLTGKRPFVARTVSALLVAIATEDPRPPSALVPSIPVELEAVVLRCLEKEPKDRFVNLTALESALGSLGARAAGSGASARLASLRPTPWLWAGALAAALVGFGLFLAQRRVPDATRAAPSPELRPADANPEPIVQAASSPAPLLVVRCDRPLPLGSVRLSTDADPGSEALPWQRVIPASWLCEAATTDARRQELLDTLREAKGSVRARLEVPDPFYRIELLQAPGRVEITGSRRARAPMTLVLGRPHCRAIQSVRAVAEGIADVLAEPGERAPADPCQRRVLLPAEAWGKLLRFELDPAGFVAAPALFASERLTLEVRKQSAGRRAPDDPRLRCAPPDFLHCRD